MKRATELAAAQKIDGARAPLSNRPTPAILASRLSRHAPGAQRCVSRRVLYRCCFTALCTAPRCGRPPRRRDLDGSTEELRQIATAVTPSWRRPPGSQRAHGIQPCNPCRLGVERPGMLILAGDGRGLPLDYGELCGGAVSGTSGRQRCTAGSGDLTHRCCRWQPLEAREPEDRHERVHSEASRQEEQDEPHPAGSEAR
jgi:hypothetical protein